LEVLAVQTKHHSSFYPQLLHTSVWVAGLRRVRWSSAAQRWRVTRVLTSTRAAHDNQQIKTAYWTKCSPQAEPDHAGVQAETRPNSRAIAPGIQTVLEHSLAVTLALGPAQPQRGHQKPKRHEWDKGWGLEEGDTRHAMNVRPHCRHSDLKGRLSTPPS
jgi:hypothetical protein